jgi:hypothetical protein
MSGNHLQFPKVPSIFKNVIIFGEKEGLYKVEEGKRRN